MTDQVPGNEPQAQSSAEDLSRSNVIVTKVKFGYRKLTNVEAVSRQFGAVGLKIAKDANCTAILHEIRQRLLRKESLNEVASYLNEQKVPVGPYAIKKSWTGPLLEGLVRSPLLQGVLGTGTTQFYYPELAHFTPSEQEEVWRELDSRNRRRPSEQPNPRLGVARNSTLWPGRGILCENCHEPLWWVSATQLKCRNARPGSGNRCWNQVLVPAPLLLQKLFPQLVVLLGHHPQLLDNLIDATWAEYPGTSHQGHQLIQILETQMVELDQQTKRLAEAIAKVPNSAALVDQLVRTESEVRRLTDLCDETKRRLADTSAWISREDVVASLAEKMAELSKTSYSFGERLRAMFPDIVVHPVQALDSAQVRPRIIVRVHGGTTTPEIPSELVIDAFDPPDYIKHSSACARFLAENPYLGTCHAIGQHLGLHKVTVNRALRYAEVMQQHQADDPYVVLTQPPKKASRWRKQSLQQLDAT